MGMIRAHRLHVARRMPHTVEIHRSHFDAWRVTIDGEEVLAFAGTRAHELADQSREDLEVLFATTDAGRDWTSSDESRRRFDV